MARPVTIGMGYAKACATCLGGGSLYSAVGFIVAIVYLVLYAGLDSFRGVLGWSSEEQLQRDVAANDAKLEALIEPWRTLTVEQLAGNAEAVGDRPSPLSRQLRGLPRQHSAG